MKRRDTFRLIPLSIAGFAGYGGISSAQEMPDRPPHRESEMPLSVRYLERVRGMLSWIRRTQSENLLEASHAIARTVLNKRTCWYSWDMGHSVTADIFPGRPGVPDLFTVGYNPKTAKKGDLMLSSIWTGVNAFIEGMGSVSYTHLRAHET